MKAQDGAKRLPVIGDMLDALRTLVSSESPSADLDAVASCADVVTHVVADITGRKPERIDIDGRVHLHWPATNDQGVLLLGHFDTVWPLHTIDRWPFSVDGNVATGPGTFDMKGGIVQGLFAMRKVARDGDVSLLLTSDEELGSPTSQGLIEEAALRARAVLVLEPSADGHLKIARKGCSTYRVTAIGRAAHAGLEPHKGANALLEVSAQALALADIPRGATTVTPTWVEAGTTKNTVPERARLFVDVRVETLEEEARVHEVLLGLEATVDGVRLEVVRDVTRPPMVENPQMFERAQRLAASLGLEPFDGVAVGGGSDGNFTAAMGIPTLDGLGPVGDGAHAEGEHLLVDKMPERAELVAALIEDLLNDH